MKPAVAVMAKVPGLGPVKSRLHRCLTPEAAEDLYRCFLLDRLEALGRMDSVAPVVAFTPAAGETLVRGLAPPGFSLVPQRGDDLGARLCDVLSSLLAEGHPAAIAIDSDSPTLPMRYVALAADILVADAADVVLGPCDDGGYYLIGTVRAEPRLFEEIPWSTERVLALTVEKAETLGLRTHLLPRWFDVDEEADLRRLHLELASATDPPPRTFAYVTALYGPEKLT